MPLRGEKLYVKTLRRKAGVELINHIAHTLMDKAQEVSPIRTGNLYNSYYVDEANKPGDKASVGNTAEYFDYVDKGTERMAPRAMIQQAIDSISPNARKYLRRLG